MKSGINSCLRAKVDTRVARVPARMAGVAGTQKVRAAVGTGGAVAAKAAHHAVRAAAALATAAAAISPTAAASWSRHSRAFVGAMLSPQQRREHGTQTCLPGYAGKACHPTPQ